MLMGLGAVGQYIVIGNGLIELVGCQIPIAAIDQIIEMCAALCCRFDDITTEVMLDRQRSNRALIATWIGGIKSI